MQECECGVVYCCSCREGEHVGCRERYHCRVSGTAAGSVRVRALAAGNVRVGGTTARCVSVRTRGTAAG